MPKFVRIFLPALAALAVVLGFLFPWAPQAAGAVRLEPLPWVFAKPLFVTYAPDDPETLFVVEQVGRIRVFRQGKEEEALLDLRGRVSGGYEQGLLGLAFHPQFQENRYFYVNYTDLAGTTRVVRYRAEDGRYVADPQSAQVLLSIPQPAANHNGGMIAFGPDGYLYIATGDGGQAGDPWGNAQNPSTLLGKLLRIDVDGGTPYAIPPDNPFAGGGDARPEIWALGLRNPWRFSFDRLTGDLYIADVGQESWEEVNFEPRGSAGGKNYGWNVMEGSHCYPAARACSPEGFALPVAEYVHSGSNGCSITGGYVYRGEAIPSLYGAYLFADYCTGKIWAMWAEGKDQPFQVEELFTSGLQISSFGEDSRGELYVTDIRGGRVYRLVPGDA